MEKYYSLGPGMLECWRVPEKQKDLAIQEARRMGTGFIVEHSIDLSGVEKKTILGWHVRIISYKMAKAEFSGNLAYLNLLEQYHSHGKNEVFAFVFGRKMFIPMSGYNYRKIPKP